jgi:hypothetical protein
MNEIIFPNQALVCSAATGSSTDITAVGGKNLPLKALGL